MTLLAIVARVSLMTPALLFSSYFCRSTPVNTQIPINIDLLFHSLGMLVCTGATGLLFGLQYYFPDLSNTNQIIVASLLGTPSVYCALLAMANMYRHCKSKVLPSKEESQKSVEKQLLEEEKYKQRLERMEQFKKQCVQSTK